MLALDNSPIERPIPSVAPPEAPYPVGEAALLITCVHGLPFCVPPDTDWHTLLELAEQNGVLLLVYQRFCALSADIPGFFHEAVQQCRASAELLSAELEALLRSFAELDIEVLPLKGPALSLALYGDGALRQSNDIDLLVRRHDFPRAEAWLLRQGFSALGAVSEHDRRFLRGELLVELHFELISPRSFPFDVDRVWGRSLRTNFRGTPAQSMFKNDLVLFLCAHGLKHGFSRLIWILDLSQALQGWEDRDYRDLVWQAQRSGLQTWLCIGCEVVRIVFPQQLPAALDTAIATSPAALERARRAATRLISEYSEVVVNDYRRFYLQAEPNPFKRWRYRLRYLTPTETDFRWASRHHIHPWMMPILRPFRMLEKYGLRRVWRILFPSNA